MKTIMIYESTHHGKTKKLVDAVAQRYEIKTMTVEEASRVEKQRDKNLKNVSKVLEKSQKSVNRSRRSWYSLAICSFLLFLFLLGAILFLKADVFFPDSSSLDNSSEMCYTEPYDNNAGSLSPQNLP